MIALRGALLASFVAALLVESASGQERKPLMIRSAEDANRVFAEAVNSGDIDAVLGLNEDGARVAFPGNPHVGRSAIRSAFQGLLAQKPNMRAETRSLSVAGDLALLSSRWTCTGVGSDGKPIEQTGDSIEVLRRQADGSWRYVIDLPIGKE